MILIREFFLERDHVIYTGRDSVLPNDNIDHATLWADTHIPDWINIELFKIQPMNITVEEQ